MMQRDPSATAGSGSDVSTTRSRTPRLVRAMPRDVPLVLRPRVLRLAAVFGALYLGIPSLILLISPLWEAISGSAGWADVLLIAGFALRAVALTGGATLLVTLAFAVGNGPHLAAAPGGIWVRDWKWRTRRVFLPWEVVEQIGVGRPLLWRVVFVSAPVRIAGDEVAMLVDTEQQPMVFTASPFFCARRPQDLLAELSGLSGGRAPIG